MRLVGPSAPATKRRLAVEPLGLDRRAPGEPGAVAVEVVDDVLHAVVGLGDRVDEKVLVSRMSAPAMRIGEMDVLDRLRLGQREKIVVPLEMAVAGGKALAAEMRLFEPRPWIWVPIAPSSTRMRLAASARKRASASAGAVKSENGSFMAPRRGLVRHKRISISLCRHRQALRRERACNARKLGAEGRGLGV